MTNARQTYLCDIVPFAHIPRSRDQFFWYTSDVPLTLGTLVRVPLFRRTLHGVVLSCRAHDAAHTGTIRLKSVIAVSQVDYFTHRQIALATHIAETTSTSLGTVLQQFYTPPTTERTHAICTKQTKKHRLPSMTTTQKSIAKDVLTAQKYTSILLRDTSITARDALYIHLIKKILDQNTDTQILFLVPEILIAEQTFKRLCSFFDRANIAVIHNKISKGARWSNYQKIADGTARIIVGTRLALFQPFQNLALIIVDEEHDMSFKQWDRAPRYDARTVADTLARMHTAPIISVSAAPRITRTVPIALAPTPHMSAVTLVNMRQVHFERIKKSNKKKLPITLFSPQLLNAITDALAKKEQILLFFNHKGMSSFSLCTNCQTLLACRTCDRALVLTKEGHYECFHCNYVTDVFPKCSDCKSMTFRNVGYGTQKIENMLGKLFPKARIARIDGHSMRGTHAATDLIEKYAAGEIDIILGTQMALKDWRSDTLSVVGIIDADALLSIPDIHADERLFAFISNAAAAVTHKNSSGTAFIQTYKPSYRVFEYAAALDYDAFRRSILHDRKALNYPPYWRVMKVILQHKDSQKVRDLATDWYEKITALNIDVDINAWIISRPHPPLLPKLRGLHRMQIIIRLKNPTKKIVPIPERLTTLLSAIPPRTIIDVDPVSLV